MVPSASPSVLVLGFGRLQRPGLVESAFQEADPLMFWTVGTLVCAILLAVPSVAGYLEGVQVRPMAMAGRAGFDRLGMKPASGRAAGGAGAQRRVVQCRGRRCISPTSCSACCPSSQSRLAACRFVRRFASSFELKSMRILLIEERGMAMPFAFPRPAAARDSGWWACMPCLLRPRGGALHLRLPLR